MNTKTFNIKDYFNFKLYLQGLKRLRLAGVVSLICICALAVLSIGANYITIISGYASWNLPVNLVDTINSHYTLMYFVVYLIVPLMSLIIWNYLNHRNGSDFYHAVASKRKAVYLSFFAAVLTWAAILVASIALTVTVMYLLCSGLYIIDIGSVIVFSFNILVSSVLVAAAFAIGCSLSGTIFSNLTISVCILFVPRFIITLLCLFVCSEISILDAPQMALLFRSTCNLPASTLLSPIANMFSYSYLNDIAYVNFAELGFPTLYTLVLGLIYTVLGNIAYYRRPSETAGKSAAYRWVQRIITMLMGYFISLIVVCMTFYYILNFDSLFEYFENIINFGITFVMVYFFALVCMFIYDIITTKSAKAALKSIIYSPILLVLDALTVIILVFAHMSILSYTPDDKDISYVKVNISELYNSYEIESMLSDNEDTDYSLVKLYDTYDNDDYYYVSDIYYSTTDYINKQLSDKKITDKDIIALLCDALKTDVQYEKDCHSLYGAKEYPDYYYSDDIYQEGSYSVYVTFGNGITETYREITISRAVYSKILAHLVNSDDYKELITNLASSDNAAYIKCTGLTKKQTAEIYKTYKEELKNIDPAEYYNYYSSSYIANELEVYRFMDGRPTKVSLPLTQATPKSLGLYLMYFNENNSKDFYEMYDVISKDIKNTDKTDNMDLEDINFNSYDLTPSLYGIAGTGYQSSYHDYFYEDIYYDIYYDDNYDDDEYDDTYISSDITNKEKFEDVVFVHPLETLDKYIKNFQTNMSNSDLKNFDRDKYVLCYIDLGISAIDEPFKTCIEDDGNFTGSILFGSYESCSYDYFKNIYLYFLVDKEDIDQAQLHKSFEGTSIYNFYVVD